MTRDDYDRHLARDRPGLYESHYVKANSPAGDQAFWIKHNLLVPPAGGGIAEFWLAWFRRGEPPRVWKREVPVATLELRADALGLRGEHVRLDASGCENRIGNASWRLAFSGGLAPMFHMRAPLYRGAFPKKKLLIPAPNLVFDGEVAIGERTISIARWVGLRGHNWGTEHAYTYATGGCNVWDDGAADRAIDGFTARIKLGGAVTPWLSSLVFRGDGRDVEKNHVLHWLNRRAEVEPTAWRLPYRGLALAMHGEAAQYAGLRYRHPGGLESYCYNTKFAAVTVTAGARTFTSTAGEHEVLYPEPLPAIPLHPTAGWTQRDGDYQSQ